MTISANLKSDVSQTEMDEVLVQLLELSHPNWNTTYRICNHNADINHQGNVYTAWSFNITLVNEQQGQLPQLTLVIDNVNTLISQAIKLAIGSRTRITVVAKLVCLSTPDYIERGPTTMKIKSVRCNIFQVAASLTLLAVEFDSVPRKKIDPTNFPGAFGVIR